MLEKEYGWGLSETGKITIETLIRKLNDFLKILNAHGVDPEIVNQIFKQVCQKKKKII